MALAGWARVLSSGSRAVGLLFTLFVVLGMSFACSPVPYNTSSDSPYARPVKPEDLFVEEADQVFRIEPGDSLEVVVRRGAGEERSIVTVRDNGRVYVGSLDVDVKNLTVSEAEARITEQAATIIRNPRVEVSIKQKKFEKHKMRVFLLGGGVGAGGSGAFYATTQARFAELDRKTTVGQLVAQLGYSEYAVLDEIRVIRGDARKPEVVPVDVKRLYQYGDRSRDIVLKDNDIVFVPRER